MTLVCCRIAAIRGQGTLDKWKRHAIAGLPGRAMFIQGSDPDGDGRGRTILISRDMDVRMERDTRA